CGSSSPCRSKPGACGATRPTSRCTSRPTRSATRSTTSSPARPRASGCCGTGPIWTPEPTASTDAAWQLLDFFDPDRQGSGDAAVGVAEHEVEPGGVERHLPPANMLPGAGIVGELEREWVAVTRCHVVARHMAALGHHSPGGVDQRETELVLPGKRVAPACPGVEADDHGEALE